MFLLEYPSLRQQECVWNTYPKVYQKCIGTVHDMWGLCPEYLPQSVPQWTTKYKVHKNIPQYVPERIVSGQSEASLAVALHHSPIPSPTPPPSSSRNPPMTTLIHEDNFLGLFYYLSHLLDVEEVNDLPLQSWPSSEEEGRGQKLAPPAIPSFN